MRTSITRDAHQFAGCKLLRDYLSDQAALEFPREWPPLRDPEALRTDERFKSVYEDYCAFPVSTKRNGTEFDVFEGGTPLEGFGNWLASERHRLRCRVFKESVLAALRMGELASLSIKQDGRRAETEPDFWYSLDNLDCIENDIEFADTRQVYVVLEPKIAAKLLGDAAPKGWPTREAKWWPGVEDALLYQLGAAGFGIDRDSGFSQKKEMEEWVAVRLQLLGHDCSESTLREHVDNVLRRLIDFQTRAFPEQQLVWAGGAPLERPKDKGKKDQSSAAKRRTASVAD